MKNVSISMIRGYRYRLSHFLRILPKKFYYVLEFIGTLRGYKIVASKEPVT